MYAYFKSNIFKLSYNIQKIKNITFRFDITYFINIETITMEI